MRLLWKKFLNRMIAEPSIYPSYAPPPKEKREMPQWLIGGNIFEAWTAGEARAKAKAWLGVGPKGRLPIGMNAVKVSATKAA